MLRLRRLVPDDLIPGTLNVGRTMPVAVQAVIYIVIIEVDPWTLVLLIAAAIAGAWFGAGVVAGLSRQRIQVGMGLALLTAAALMVMTQFGWFPAGRRHARADGHAARDWHRGIRGCGRVDDARRRFLLRALHNPDRPVRA